MSHLCLAERLIPGSLSLLNFVGIKFFEIDGPIFDEAVSLKDSGSKFCKNNGLCCHVSFYMAKIAKMKTCKNKLTIRVYGLDNEKNRSLIYCYKNMTYLLEFVFLGSVHC